MNDTNCCECVCKVSINAGSNFFSSEIKLELTHLLKILVFLNIDDINYMYSLCYKLTLNPLFYHIT